MGSYKGRTFVREQSYVCGNYMDADIYPVFQKPGIRRKKSKPTTEIQEKLNQRNAERRFIRLANLNFNEHDYALHLTYVNQPESADEAARLARNYIRRINRRRKKAGLEPAKYLLTTEHGKKSGRVHHHLIISGGLSRDEMEDAWKLGTANCLRLQFDAEQGITGLASYISKERSMYKRWSGSRNLIQPEPVQRDGAMTLDDLDDLGEAAEAGLGYNELERMYPGWRCVECSGERNNVNHAWYVRARFVRIAPEAEKNKQRTGADARRKTGAAKGSL